MIQTVQKILKYTNNLHTKVENKEGFKGNYYNYITDTIYISKNIARENNSKNNKGISKQTSELIVLCHECIHASQNKMEHILNFLLSNIIIIFAPTYFILKLFAVVIPVAKITLLVLLGLSIITRIKLELQAINKSTVLAKEVVQERLIEDISLEEINLSEKYIKRHKILALIGMILDKILIIGLVVII